MLQPLWRDLPTTPWTLSRPESLQKNQQEIDRLMKQVDECENWKDVHNFMFSGDKDTFIFVLNQLMRTLGVKRKKKKEKKRRDEGATSLMRRMQAQRASPAFQSSLSAASPKKADEVAVHAN